MSSPLEDPTPGATSARRNWLLRYIGVQEKYDAAINTALRDATEDAGSAISNLVGSGIGEQVRRSQIRSAKAAIRDVIKILFGNIQGHVEAGQSDAAVAAVEAGVQEDQRVLKALFPDRRDREAYIDQARQQAARGVRNMLGRVLGESYVPLSQQVHRTRALADGQVDRIINSSLARGASWNELAGEVRGSIRPDVPGGVGYAAKRLARTEINNAFHSQSIADVQNKPWVSWVEWRLSKVHKPQGCVCEHYAKLKKFQKERIPQKPHPNCICYTVPVMEDWDSFQMQLLAGNYDQFKS